MSDEQSLANQATSCSELERQIMSSLVPKNEREHWAARKIEQLRAELAAAQAQLVLANECRLTLIHQVYELADHIERADYYISDPDMKKQLKGQREYSMKVADNWNQNGTSSHRRSTGGETIRLVI